MASHLINAIKQKFDTTVQSDWGTQWENENPLANGMWRTEEKRPAALSFFYNIWLLIYAFCLKLAQPIGTISMVFTSTEQSDWLNQTQ